MSSPTFLGDCRGRTTQRQYGKMERKGYEADSAAVPPHPEYLPHYTSPAFRSTRIRLNSSSASFCCQLLPPVGSSPSASFPLSSPPSIRGGVVSSVSDESGAGGQGRGLTRPRGPILGASAEEAYRKSSVSTVVKEAAITRPSRLKERQDRYAHRPHLRWHGGR
jgi:hypothetical protein